MWIIPSGIIIDNLQLYGRLNPTFADYTSPANNTIYSLYCRVANSLQSKNIIIANIQNHIKSAVIKYLCSMMAIIRLSDAITGKC